MGLGWRITERRRDTEALLVCRRRRKLHQEVAVNKQPPAWRSLSALCDSALTKGLAPSGHSAGRLTQWRGKALATTRLRGSKALRHHARDPTMPRALQLVPGPGRKFSHQPGGNTLTITKRRVHETNRIHACIFETEQRLGSSTTEYRSTLSTYISRTEPTNRSHVAL